MPKSRKQSGNQTKSQLPTSDRAFEARNRALHVLARMRHDALSLQVASREEGTTPTTVRKYFPNVLRRSKRGKWTVIKDDHEIRALRVPGAHGPVTVYAQSYTEAQLVSAYLVSLNRWRRTQKRSELAPFHGKSVGGYELITAERTLRALDDADLLQLDTLYAAQKEVI